MARCVVTAALPVVLAVSGIIGAPRARADGCPATGTGAVGLSAVEPGLDLRLADGRVLRLVGIESAAGTPDDPTRGDAARDALRAMLTGHVLSIVPLSARRDRWGRLPAWAFVAGDTTSGGVTAGGVTSGSLASAAIAAGLARYRPEPDAAPCRTELLAAEAAARRARLGLWRDPYYSVLAVDDRAAFAERAGTNVLVEARLVAVEPGPFRTRLRFAAPSSGRGRRLEATIVPRAMKTFEAQGVDFSSLIGRTLRLRGLLDERFGLRLELARPDEVEIVPPSGAPAPAGLTPLPAGPK